MTESTSALVGAPTPRTFTFRAASDGHRVIYHEPICPDLRVLRHHRRR